MVLMSVGTRSSVYGPFASASSPDGPVTID